MLKGFARLRGTCSPLNGLHVFIAIQTLLKPFDSVRLDNLVWTPLQLRECRGSTAKALTKRKPVPLEFFPGHTTSTGRRVQGVRVQGSGRRVQGARVQGAGFRVSGRRVQGVRIQGSGFRAHGAELRVSGLRA